MNYTSALADATGNIQFTGDATRVESVGCFPGSTTDAAFAVYSTHFMSLPSGLT